MHVYSSSETPEVDRLCSQSIKLTPLRFMYGMNHEITVYFVLFMTLLEYQDSTSLHVCELKCTFTGITAFPLHEISFTSISLFLQVWVFRWRFKRVIFEDYVIFIFLDNFDISPWSNLNGTNPLYL